MASSKKMLIVILSVILFVTIFILLFISINNANSNNKLIAKNNTVLIGQISSQSKLIAKINTDLIGKMSSQSKSISQNERDVQEQILNNCTSGFLLTGAKDPTTKNYTASYEGQNTLFGDSSFGYSFNNSLKNDKPLPKKWNTASINNYCQANVSHGEFYINDKPTCVGNGFAGDKCDNTKVYCAGPNNKTFGSTPDQVTAFWDAANNTNKPGVHPGCPHIKNIADP